ncbi:hypothetical protein [Streptacidiphilus melanogenes]|uniref:hypothetical protein n=1 Tax=Streptacidiphilus melanogenes TaxID=411235 RepID=UPI001269A272|nr:hypothetical protein [Streptacidiphilus melanogenes]
MRRIAQFATVATVALGSALGVAGVADAATPSPTLVRPMSYHSGSSGCFNWSWADGITSTTVYYHNTCNYTATLDIWWKTGSVQSLHAVTAKAGAKGSIKENGSISSIS